MIDSTQRLKNTLTVFRNVKYTYYSFYKPISSRKYEGLVSYYTSLQHVFLFAENTLILQLSILLDENEKFSLIKTINCLLADKQITNDNSKRFKEELKVDSVLRNKIKDFRDKYVSHLDFKAIGQPPDYITNLEYELLLQTIESVLDSIMRSQSISENLNLIAPIGMETTLDNLAEFIKCKFNKDVIETPTNKTF